MVLMLTGATLYYEVGHPCIKRGSHTVEQNVCVKRAWYGNHCEVWEYRQIERDVCLERK